MSNLPDASVYMVPLIDVNWLTFAPFDPGRDFRVDPPKVEQSIGETRELCGILKDLTDGKSVLTPHSGTYCRIAYYEGEIVEVYKESIANGGELAIHLHEEIKGEGTRFGEYDHIRTVFLECKKRYEDAGLSANSYRGGHYAYAGFMNDLLEENGIHMDFSCSPGLHEPTREAVWDNARFSGYYLPKDPRGKIDGSEAMSKVFEIPMGSDGLGTQYENILHVEQSELENLQRIWSVIARRAETEGRVQIVHSLFHSGSMGRQEYVERYKRFLNFTAENGGVFVTPSEAKKFFDEWETGSR